MNFSNIGKDKMIPLFSSAFSRIYIPYYLYMMSLLMRIESITELKLTLCSSRFRLRKLAIMVLKLSLA